MRLELPLETRNESNQRGHWAVKARRTKAQRQATALAAKVPARSLGAVLEVRLTRIAPRQLDSDGVPAALKAVRDGLADALRIDDGSPLVLWTYAQETGPYAVRIEVDKVPSLGMVATAPTPANVALIETALQDPRGVLASAVWAELRAAAKRKRRRR